MKKGILVAILALLTSAVFVGCGQKSDEQANNDAENTTVATETAENTQEESNTENGEEKKDEENSAEEQNDNGEEQKGEPAELGAQDVQGETVEGAIYNGRYRVINGSDRVVVEWTEDMFKYRTEYVYTGDKLSDVCLSRTYTDEAQAKADYDMLSKQNEDAKKLKSLDLNGATIKYTFEDSEWEELKNYSKQQMFEEQKKLYEKLSQVDDIRSDD